jgi:hypothetical protein
MKRFPILIIIISLLFIQACSKQKTETKRYLGEEAMIDLLVDIHLTESAVLIKQNEGIRSDSLSLEFYGKLFDKHGVSRDRYERSLEYYVQYPEKMEKMYEEVYKRLSSMQAEFKVKNNIEEIPYE